MFAGHTALRDIDDLIHSGILAKESAGGRSTSYLRTRNGRLKLSFQ